MQPGSNGPPILNGAVNNYDRAVCSDSPFAVGTGAFADPKIKTLVQLREKMMVRMGYAAMLASPPPGMTQELNSYLEDAQEQLYLDYATLRTQRWWGWQMVAGQRIYDTPVDCTNYLDTMRITWAGIADNGGTIVSRFVPSKVYGLGQFIMPTVAGDVHYEVTVAGTSGTEPAWPTTIGATVASGGATFTARAPKVSMWLQLQQGINPLTFNSPSPGYPTNFEVGEFVEVWPAPKRPMVLWILGHMGIRRFTADTDTPTIDTELVFLFALANAKAHRGQPDAGNYASMARKRISRLIAMTHGLNRYIPRESTAGVKADAGMECGSWPLPRGNWR